MNRENVKMAEELIAQLEQQPMFAIGLALLSDAEWAAVAEHARRVLLAKAARAKLVKLP